MNKYLNYMSIPFKEKGRDFSGCDCWGLVRLILQKERGIELPSFTESYENTKDCERIWQQIEVERLTSKWQSVPLEEIQEGDVLLFKMKKHVSHIAYTISKYDMIHIETGCGTVIERWYKTLKWEKRLMEAFRYVG